MRKPRPIPALLLFFVLIWLVPALACGSSSEPTSEPVATFTPTPEVELLPQEKSTQPLEEQPPADTPTTALAAPTDTPAPAQPSGAMASAVANLRSGPSTDFAIVGQAQPGQALPVVAQNEAGDWYQLEDGAWIAAFLVDGAPGDLPVAEASSPPAQVVESTATVAPAQTGATEAAPAEPAASSGAVALLILVNSGRNEILGVRNDGGAAVNISGWRLDGSKGEDFCIIPSGTVLQPGETFTVATGDAQPQGRGYKCGDKPIWNNDAETIFLRSTDGRVFQVVTG